MVKLEERTIQTLPLSARRCGAVEVCYSFPQDLEMKDATQFVNGKIEERAPKNSRFYVLGKSHPNRPVGWGIAGMGPLSFIQEVTFYK